jgi:hypothetical protein
MNDYAVAIFDLDESACAKTVAAVEEQGGKAADQTTPSSTTSSSNTPQTDFRVLQHGRGLLREAGKEPPSGAGTGIRPQPGQDQHPCQLTSAKTRTLSRGRVASCLMTTPAEPRKRLGRCRDIQAWVELSQVD